MVIYRNHLERIDKIKNMMSKRDVDALLLSDGTTIAYTAGLFFTESLSLAGWGFGSFVLIPKDEDPLIFCHPFDVPRLKSETWISEIRVLKKPTTLEEVMREKGLEKSTIGVEEGSLRVNCYLSLKRILPNAVFKDVTKSILDLMTIKDDEEIELLKKAAEIADVGMYAALDSIRVGISEIQITGEAERAMRYAGADGAWWQPTQVGAGDPRRIPMDQPYAEAFPRDKIIQKGDVVKIDTHPTYHLYGGDMMSTAIVGQPTREHKQLCDVVTQSALETIGNALPGIAVKELYEHFYNFIKKAGYEKYMAYQLGHGSGIGQFHGNLRMPPILDPLSEDVLKENMVISIHPGIYKPGVGGMLVESVGLVKKPRFDLFNKAPIELVIISKDVR